MTNLTFKCAIVFVLGIVFGTSLWFAYWLVSCESNQQQEYEAPVEWQALFKDKQLQVTNSSMVVESGTVLKDCLIIYMGDGPAIEVQEKAWSDTDLLLTIVTPKGVRNLITTR